MSYWKNVTKDSNILLIERSALKIIDEDQKEHISLIKSRFSSYISIHTFFVENDNMQEINLLSCLNSNIQLEKP